MLSAPKVAAVMKHTRTIEVCVYTRKIDDSEMPISAENTQNSIWAAAGCSRLMPAEITNTITSGAKMSSHFRGLTYIACTHGVRKALPNLAAPADGSVVTAAI